MILHCVTNITEGNLPVILDKSDMEGNKELVKQMLHPDILSVLYHSPQEETFQFS